MLCMRSNSRMGIKFAGSNQAVSERVAYRLESFTYPAWPTASEKIPCYHLFVYLFVYLFFICGLLYIDFKNATQNKILNPKLRELQFLLDRGQFF